jgi:hypothetical protein
MQLVCICTTNSCTTTKLLFKKVLKLPQNRTCAQNGVTDVLYLLIYNLWQFPYTKTNLQRQVNIQNSYRTFSYLHCTCLYQQDQRLVLTNIDSMIMLHGQVRRTLEQHTRMMYVTRNVALQQTRNSASSAVDLASVTTSHHGYTQLVTVRNE